MINKMNLTMLELIDLCQYAGIIDDSICSGHILKMADVEADTTINVMRDDEGFDFKYGSYRTVIKFDDMDFDQYGGIGVRIAPEYKPTS